ncbi:LysR family transcriptional regulator [Saccharopolyspora sp. NPDC049357]|uniref:LysR family transcriptional regulator n=1 Tax=Saccharopolyspora sp. NPDC049357 TaxID=3154507 RepID=UPI00343BA20E
MDLRLVRYFLAVVDHGGITRAAQALYIAQPSLSQAIRTLERELGVELFDRSGRQLTLSSDGEAFAGPARNILIAAEGAKAKVRSVHDLAAGRLEIATVSTLAVDPLAELTSGLLSRHPDVLVNVLDPGSPAGVVSQVRRGKAEFGLVELPVKGDEALRSRELLEQEITLVLPPALAADLPDPVPIEAIAAIPLVLEVSDAGGVPLIDHRLAQAVGNVAVECAHRQAIWDLVMRGAGATFLPRQIAETQLHGVVVRSLTPSIERTIGLLFRRGPLSPAAAAFLDVAEIIRVERSRERVPRTPGRQETGPKVRTRDRKRR